MANVKAIRNFEHYGRRRRGTAFILPDPTAFDLARRGLVEIIKEPKPVPPAVAGARRSALPAAPASQQTKSKASEGGAKKKVRKKRAASSSRTPASG
jgi:hypothetical protein